MTGVGELTGRIAARGVGFVVVVAGLGFALGMTSVTTAGVGQSSLDLSSGVGAVQGVQCNGRPAKQLGLNRPNGTAFLVGRQVMMTAAHVAKGWFLTTEACSLRVRIGKSWFSASRLVYWTDPGTRDPERADIATFALDRPAWGHIFAFASRTPTVRSTVRTFGFPWGEPLETSSGVLLRKTVLRGVPLVVVKQKGTEGPHSGGPIVDSRGSVISDVSRVIPERPVDPNAIPNYGGIDIPKWWAGGVTHDLCRVYPGKGVLGCSPDRQQQTKDAIPLTK